MASGLTVGVVASRAGVRVDTVRYYERRGVLPVAERRPSGYRTFAPQAVDRILFVKELQTLGFSLDDVIELLRLVDSNTTSCSTARKHVEKTLAQLDEKIAALTSMRTRLASVLDACQTDTCSQLEELSPLIRLSPARRLPIAGSG